MHITNELFTDEFQYKLIEAQFVDIEEDQINNRNLQQNDKVLNIEVHDDCLEIQIKRKVSFSPPGLFEITVTFSVRRFFNEPVKKETITVDNLSDLEINDIIAGTMARASSIISSITGQFTNAPVITPPIYISEE